MTTETKPSVKKPDAEVVGSFAEVIKRGPCDDGRILFCFNDRGDFDGNHCTEIFVLAVSKIRAWEALHPDIGSIEKMTKARLAERTTQYALQLMEEQNAKTETSE